VREYLESDGEEGHLWDNSAFGGNGSVHTLLLVTLGRKTGRAQTLPIGYTKTDAGYVIAGSKGGAPKHPAWYLNLVANPDVSVQLKSDRFEARARVVEGRERDVLWAMLVSATPEFEQYQAGVERQIPVVVLEPV
jgi:deazaflavin-dependent oxidoreductase (nitroreductase family)